MKIVSLTLLLIRQKCPNDPFWDLRAAHASITNSSLELCVTYPCTPFAVENGMFVFLNTGLSRIKFAPALIIWTNCNLPACSSGGKQTPVTNKVTSRLESSGISFQSCKTNPPLWNTTWRSGNRVWILLRKSCGGSQGVMASSLWPLRLGLAIWRIIVIFVKWHWITGKRCGKRWVVVCGTLGC